MDSDFISHSLVLAHAVASDGNAYSCDSNDYYDALIDSREGI